MDYSNDIGNNTTLLYFPVLPKPCLPVCKVLICLSGAFKWCVQVRCLPRHVAIAIDLSDVAARAKEKGKWRRGRGFWPVAIFLLLSIYSWKGQKYSGESKVISEGTIQMQ